MLILRENELILAVVRKHWYVMAKYAVVMIGLFFVPPIVWGIIPLASVNISRALLDAAANFFMSLYIMALALISFLFWTDYYLDMWIVTDQRILDIEQNGLFSREVSEIPLSRVQDVTIEIHGIIETLLKFGTIRIQTAGEREFVIHDAPRPYETKDTILNHAHNAETGAQTRIYPPSLADRT